NLKLGKAKYIIYKLSNDRLSIVVEKEVATSTYDDFLADLPDINCRYAVYNFDYTIDEDNHNKIVFYAWSPDVAQIRDKMAYVSSKEALLKELDGIDVQIMGTYYDDVAHGAVLYKINRSQT
ncbi:cofilin, partial [Mortierella sp. AM989]